MKTLFAISLTHYQTRIYENLLYLKIIKIDEKIILLQSKYLSKILSKYLRLQQQICLNLRS